MLEIIEDTINGKIEYERGRLDFSVAEVDISVCRRETVEGSFMIFAPEGKMTEGYVRSSDNRMELVQTKFSGVQDEIQYRFHGELLDSDQTVDGQFRIVSNHGEYVIPFHAAAEEKVLQSSMGPVRNLFHFVNLSKTNWPEAVDIFYDPHFIQILTGNDSRFVSLYKGLSGEKGSAHNVESFLVNVGKKKPVELLTDVSEIRIDDPVADTRYQFTVSRNGWGYIRMSIAAEGDFLEVDERLVTEDDFLGNIYLVYYYVNCKKLHEGKNFGKIKVLRDHTEQVIPVMISVQRQRRQFKQMAYEKHSCTRDIMEYYKSFRLKRISSKIWLTETGKLVDRMIASDEYDLVARLYKVQLLITQERINEARWELDQIKVTLIDLREEKPEFWCYYLYLMTLYLEDEERIESIVAEMGEYYNRCRDHWRIAYLLSCISPEYTRNPVNKWELMESLFQGGCNSPVIYLELVQMLLVNPTLLLKLGRFELQILSYALKNGLLRSELRIQFVSLAQKEKAYDPILLKVLQGCYKENPQDDILQVICTQLIKDNRTDPKAFYWYALGVQQELRITRLFEFYMMSLDTAEAKTLPKTVLLYFSYHSDLDYRLNAFIYAYVTRHRDEDPAMYERYAFQMKEYIGRQLARGHINSDLAYLYQEMYAEQELDEETAGKLADVLFIREVTVRNPYVKRIIVAYPYTEKEMAYPVKDGIARVPIYLSSARIVLEDADHNRYIGWFPYEVHELFKSGKLAVSIAPFVKDRVGYDLYACFDKQEHIYISNENCERFTRLLQSDLLSGCVKKEICMKLVEYYYDRDMPDVLDSFLAQLTTDRISPEDRSLCLKYLVIRGFYEKAYEWLKVVGNEEIEPRYLVRLCTEMIDRMEADEEQSEPENALILLILQALKKGKYNEKMLCCLCTYFQGSLREMRDLWNACRGFGMETGALERKILLNILYTGGYIAEKQEIFLSYAAQMPDKALLAAIMTQSCYDYFVKEKLMEDFVFEALPMIEESEICLDDICGLAFLKYYAENKEKIGEPQKKYIRSFAIRLISRGRKLSYCKEFMDIVPQLGMYADKTVVEYRTKPGNKVMIHYLLEQDGDESNEYCKEEMEVVYDGVYEKSFILFFGDTVQYYITEEDEGREQLTESGTISKSDIGGEHHDSRFDLLNDMMIGRNLHDYDTVDKSLEEYYWKEFLVSDLFGERK